MKKKAEKKGQKSLKLTKETIVNLTVKSQLNGEFPCQCSPDTGAAN
jgi:hypothetical protein